MSNDIKVIIITDYSVNVFDGVQNESEVKFVPKDKMLDLKLKLKNHDKYDKFAEKISNINKEEKNG